MNQPRLFPRGKEAAIGAAPDVGEVCDEQRAGYEQKIIRSALWAAYGDALGWISELTDNVGLRRRTGGEPLRRPLAWKRRIGGPGGLTVRLPQGCYSDDSQLRLATGRAIRPDGFDVQAFAKVELPVWLSYALGGGKSTGAAAARMARSKTPWFANTFKGWSQSGGNGAAMRVQPHVWASRSPGDVDNFLLDVVRNAVCTHSHPTGIMGALLHASALAHAIAVGSPPSPADLLRAVDAVENLPGVMGRDEQLGIYWRGAFESADGEFDKAWARAVDECRHAIRVADSGGANASAQDRYSDMVDRLELRKPTKRGSGMLTAVAAAALTWREARPEEALIIAANALGTDTDTIATMAGAMLGVTADAEPPVEVLDGDLFRAEAIRLARIAHGDTTENFRYPDLLHWSPPKARSDALTRLEDEGLYVLGLGRATAMEPPIAPSKSGFQWQWIELEAGQTLLIKRRENLARYSAGPGAHERSDPVDHGADPDATPPPYPHGARKVYPDTFPERQWELSDSPHNLDRLLNYIAAHKDDDRYIGAVLRKVVNKGTRSELAAVMVAMVDMLRDPERARRPRE